MRCLPIFSGVVYEQPKRKVDKLVWAFFKVTGKQDQQTFQSLLAGSDKIMLNFDPQPTGSVVCSLVRADQLVPVSSQEIKKQIAYLLTEAEELPYAIKEIIRTALNRHEIPSAPDIVSPSPPDTSLLSTASTDSSIATTNRNAPWRLFSLPGFLSLGGRWPTLKN